MFVMQYRGMNAADRYLIQALRNYRHVSYGQFDQETHHVVQETQDAANRIEELLRELAAANDRISELEGRLEGQE